MILFGLLKDGRRRISISFMGVRYSLWFALITFIDGYAGNKDGGCGNLYGKWTAGFLRYPEVEASAM